MASSLAHLFEILWLPVASLFAGALNTIAGGGSFLSLPALLKTMQASGSTAGSVAANATNTVALWPGQLTSIPAYWQDLKQHSRRLLPLALASLVGGLTGAWLLLKTGNSMFLRLLPWLLLFAAIMFVLSEPLGRRLQRGGASRRSDFWLVVGMVAVSVYVGYFGAGGGFLVMALFGVCGVYNIHERNALKVLTAAVSIGIAVVWFIAHGKVQWRYFFLMAVLAAIGGYLGARFSRRVDPQLMRRAVALIGFLTAGYFFWKAYR